MRNLVITMTLIVASFIGSLAQSITGDWEGSVELQGMTLKLVFHVVEEGGEYSSTMDSPNQGAFGIKMDETIVDGEKLTIKNKQMGIEASTIYNVQKDIISGNFKQGPYDLPLALVRVSEDAEDLPGNNHPIAGDWNGELNLMGKQLRLVFHIVENEGSFETTMDSPDQGAYGMLADETTVEEDEISIIAKQMGINIKGTFIPDSNIIKIKFKQAHINEDLILRRERIAKKELIRPQEPKIFDYKQEDVEFVNPDGGHSLSGTLTIPKTGVFDKVVVLVSGSGPQDRNEELLGHKPFLVLSDHLSRNGIAVLRYDDRGVGKSGGDFKSGTSMDFAEDATAAVEFLKSRPDMKGKKVGVMGHSEGGLIAPIVSTKTALDFIVLLAGPATNSTDLLIEQTEAIALAGGEKKEKVDRNVASSRLIFDYMNMNPDMPVGELRQGLTEILEEQFKLLSEEELEEMGDVDKEIKDQIKIITTPWFRYFLNFNPSDYLTQVTIPVLAVNGSLDLQVLPDSNLGAMDNYLKKAGNKNYTIKEFEGLNHLFQVSLDGTGSPNEYGSIEETFNKEAMTYITDWITTLGK